MVSKSHNYKPYPARLLLAKVAEDEDFPLTWIDGNFEAREDDCVLEVELEEGEYFVFADVDLNPDEVPITKYVISVYAQGESGLEEGSYDGFLVKTIASCAFQKGA